MPISRAEADDPDPSIPIPHWQDDPDRWILIIRAEADDESVDPDLPRRGGMTRRLMPISRTRILTGHRASDPHRPLRSPDRSSHATTGSDR